MTAFLATFIPFIILSSALAWMMLTSPHPELPPMSPERQKELLIALAEHRRKRKERRLKRLNKKN